MLRLPQITVELVSLYGPDIVTVLASCALAVALLLVTVIAGALFIKALLLLFFYLVKFLTLDWRCDLEIPIEGSQSLAWRFFALFAFLIPPLVVALMTAGTDTESAVSTQLRNQTNETMPPFAIAPGMDSDQFLALACWLCGAVSVLLPLHGFTCPKKGSALKDICSVSGDYLTLVSAFTTVEDHKTYFAPLITLWLFWVWFVNVKAVLDIYLHVLETSPSGLREADRANYESMTGEKDKKKWGKLKKRAQIAAINFQVLVVFWWNSKAAIFNLFIKIVNADMVIDSLNGEAEEKS